MISPQELVKMIDAIISTKPAASSTWHKIPEIARLTGFTKEIDELAKEPNTAKSQTGFAFFALEIEETLKKILTKALEDASSFLKATDYGDLLPHAHLIAQGKTPEQALGPRTKRTPSVVNTYLLAFSKLKDLQKMLNDLDSTKTLISYGLVNSVMYDINKLENQRRIITRLSAKVDLKAAKEHFASKGFTGEEDNENMGNTKKSDNSKSVEEDVADETSESWDKDFILEKPNKTVTFHGDTSDDLDAIPDFADETPTSSTSDTDTLSSSGSESDLSRGDSKLSVESDQTEQNDDEDEDFRAIDELPDLTDDPVTSEPVTSSPAASEKPTTPKKPVLFHFPVVASKGAGIDTTPPAKPADLSIENEKESEDEECAAGFSPRRLSSVNGA